MKLKPLDEMGNNGFSTRSNYSSPRTELIDIRLGKAILTQSPEGNASIENAKFWDDDETWS